MDGKTSNMRDCLYAKVATAVMRKGEGQDDPFVMTAENYLCNHPSQDVVKRYGWNRCAGCPEFKPRV